MPFFLGETSAAIYFVCGGGVVAGAPESSTERLISIVVLEEPEPATPGFTRIDLSTAP